MNEIIEQPQTPLAQAPTDIGSLLRLAVERGLDVQAIRELATLHREMEADAARKEFARDLAAFQAECSFVRRSRRVEVDSRSGTKYAYNYAELDEIIDTIRPLMSKYGLSYGWDMDITNGQIAVVCTVRHVNGHSITSTFKGPATGGVGTPIQQTAGSNTYAKRQALVAALGLVMCDPDHDGAEAESRTESITAEQAATLESIIAEVQADRAKFLGWLGVGELTQLPARDYQRAIQGLEAKRKKAGVTPTPKEPEAETVVAFPTESAPVPDLEFAREVAALYKEFPADIRGKLRVEHSLPLGADIYPFIKTWDRGRLANLNAVLKGL